MKTKEMRQILKDAGKHVPRSNKDTEEAYKELTEPKTVPYGEKPNIPEIENPIVKLVSSNIYTYVGKGDSPPHKIKFKGVQWFTRGLAVEVRSEILESVSKNASFVKGKVEMEPYYEKDEEEKNLAEEQRKIDIQTQTKVDRVNRGLKG